jgi:hypothetical protein
MIARRQCRPPVTLNLALAAALALLGGCFDPIIGYPCAPGYGKQAGSCVRLGDGGGGDTRDGGDMTGGVAGDGGGDRPGDLPEDWVYPDFRENDDGSGGDGAGGSAAGGTTGAGGSAAGGTTGTGGTTGMDGSAAGGSTGTGGIPAGGTTGMDGSAAGGSTGTGGTAGTSGDGPGGASGADGGDAPAPADAPDGPLPVDAPPPLVCPMGLTNCSERCVNLVDDPDNCGGCATRCGSGLCLGGACQLEGVGHVVVIGHDYVVNRAGMNNIIGNSVFLSGDDPVTVLTYEGAANPQSITGTNSAIDQVASARGRRWTRQVAQRGDVAAGLATADTFLIYAQEGASDATLLQLGIDWGSTLRTFVNSGHTVVVLDGPSTNNMGTFQILTTALLFTALGRTEVTGQTLSVVAGGDAVAVRVPRSYRAEMASVAFTTLEAVKVIQTMTGEAVVVHKIF